MPITPDYQLIKPTKKENDHLEALNPAYLSVSEMSPQDRQFLNALILRYKPQKVVELGVSAGSSSVIILNALSDSANLTSIDYALNYYMDDTKPTGFMVDQYPNLKKNWQLYSGGLALNYMPKIGSGIDFCFIDTAHMNPGEILDTLMILPFLTDDAIIAFHDVNLPTFKKKVFYDINATLTNNLLMSAVHGQKLIQGDFDWLNDPRTHFPNIGAIKINPQTKSHVFELVNLLTLKWNYYPTPEEERQILSFMAEHYDSYMVDYARRIFNYQRTRPVPAKTKLKSLTKTTLESTLGKGNLTKLKSVITGGKQQ